MKPALVKRRANVLLWVLNGLVAWQLCVTSGCGLSTADKTKIRNWLTCDECDSGELESVVALSDTAVGELKKSLYGPAETELRNVALQFRLQYARTRESAGPTFVADTQYAAHYLSNFIATYQARSAIALDRIGTARARKALREALEHAADYRADVLQEIKSASVHSLTVSAGGNQTATVGTTLPTDPVILAEDDQHNPVTGLSLTFVPDTLSGLVSQTTVTTDTVTGTASTSWTLGTTPGPQRLVVRSGTDSVVVTATATPAPGPVLSYAAGFGQSAPAGTAVPVAPSVLVTDGNGNPQPGVNVNFTVTEGAGSVTGATTASGQDGIAAVGSWTLGLGVNRLRASSPGAQPTVEFVAQGRAAASVAISVGNGQTAEVGTAVAIAPAVLVSTAAGDPVEDVRVSFIVAAGGGVVVGAVQRTDASGIAAVDSWTLGPTVGPNRLRARVYQVGQVTFSATGTVGPADAMSIRSGDGQSSSAGGTLPVSPSVRVADRFGNPVPNYAVTFSPSPGRGMVVDSIVNSDADGIATVGSWTVGSAPGVDTLVAYGTGVQPLTFTALVRQPIGLVVTGPGRTYAVAVNGNLYFWGSRFQPAGGGGQLTARPESVVGLDSVRIVSTGGQHSCVVSAAGRVSCWGRNFEGQLGSGSTISSSVPVTVAAAFRFSGVAAGGSHTCADSAANSVYCWGSNTSGQLGIGSFVARSTSPRRALHIVSVASLTAGEAHTCVTATDGSAYCWGANDHGQLGVGDTDGRRSAARVDAPQRLRSIAAGGSTTCGISMAETAYCWGRNESGQLGDGSTDGRTLPTLVAGGQRFVAISVAGEHTCAVAANDAAYCWGSNSAGQLGDGTRSDRVVPTLVAGGHEFRSVAASGNHTCGVTTDGTLYCWGGGDRGQLGYGGFRARLIPTRVLQP